MAAETLGILIGIAGLYSTCIDAFEHIHVARSLGRDYELLNTRFDVQKTRLLQWGEGVGLLSKNDSDRHPSLHNQALRPTVEKMLMCIKMLLTNAEDFRTKYGLKEVAGKQIQQRRFTDSIMVVSARRTNLFKASYEQFQSMLRRHQKDSPFLRKFQWAIGGKDGFEKLITDLSDLIDNLYKIVPVMASFERLMIKEDLDAIGDVGTLRRVEEVCAQASESDNQRRWYGVASSCVEASEASAQSQGRMAVVEWLATYESYPPPLNQLVNYNTTAGWSSPTTAQGIDTHLLLPALASKDSLRTDFLHEFLTKLRFPERSYLKAVLHALGHVDFWAVLPRDVALQIVSHLDIEDLRRASQVSRRWLRVIGFYGFWGTAAGIEARRRAEEDFRDTQSFRYNNGIEYDIRRLKLLKI